MPQILRRGQTPFEDEARVVRRPARLGVEQAGGVEEGTGLYREGSQALGNSCRSVYLWQGDLAEFKERDTKKWTEYHDVETFTKDRPDGRTFWGIKLDTPCKHLIETAPGEFGCAIYDRRPYVCRIYKRINPDGPQPGCGFNSDQPERTRSAQ